MLRPADGKDLIRNKEMRIINKLCDTVLRQHRREPGGVALSNRNSYKCSFNRYFPKTMQFECVVSVFAVIVKNLIAQ